MRQSLLLLAAARSRLARHMEASRPGVVLADVGSEEDAALHGNGHNQRLACLHRAPPGGVMGIAENIDWLFVGWAAFACTVYAVVYVLFFKGE